MPARSSRKAVIPRRRTVIGPVPGGNAASWTRSTRLSTGKSCASAPDVARQRHRRVLLRQPHQVPAEGVDHAVERLVRHRLARVGSALKQRRVALRDERAGEVSTSAEAPIPALPWTRTVTSLRAERAASNASRSARCSAPRPMSVGLDGARRGVGAGDRGPTDGYRVRPSSQRTISVAARSPLGSREGARRRGSRGQGGRRRRISLGAGASTRLLRVSTSIDDPENGGRPTSTS